MRHFLLLPLALLACEGGQFVLPGQRPAPSEPGTPAPAPNKPPPAPAPCTQVGLKWGLRRLTNAEYDRTVASLLAVTTGPAKDFPARGKNLGFDNNVAVLGVDEGLAQRYLEAAEALAPKAIAQVPSCDAATLTGEVCARRFVEAFLPRAFRGPITPDEVASQLALYGRARTDGLDHAASLEVVATAILQAPRFLYRVESTTPGQPVPAHDLANRLSYALWGTQPDDTLRALAADGTLTNPSVLRAQAQRLLADPQSSAVLRAFYRQWLDVDGLGSTERSALASFQSLAPSLREEVERTAEAAHREGGTLAALLTAQDSFVDAALAQARGLSAPASGWKRVPRTAGQGNGVLTLQGVMAAQSHPTQTSPVLRGLFVRRSFFCSEPPPPPADLVVKAPEPSPTLTTRERFAVHSADPSCNSCHRLMDPVGLAFENQDNAGQWRSTENGKPIDPSGQLLGTDVDTTFQGAEGLAQALGKSPMVNSCLATQWVRFTSGQAETPADACLIANLSAGLSKGQRFDELLVTLLTSDAIRTTRAAP